MISSKLFRNRRITLLISGRLRRRPEIDNVPGG
jgi:hypothetical protein